MTTVPRRDLADALKIVAPALKAATSVPVLSGVRIADGSLTATDLDLTIATQLDADLDTVVPAAVLSRIVASLVGDTVGLTLDADQLTITCGNTSATIRTMSPTEWPKLDTPAEFDHELTAADVDALRRIEHAVARTNANGETLMGLHLKGSEAHATDSYRLAQVDLTADLPELLVPGVTMTRVLASAKAGLSIAAHPQGHSATFTNGTTSWTTRLLVTDKPYPDFGRLIASVSKVEHTCEVDSDDLVESLTRLTALGPLDQSSAHRLHTADDQLHLRRVLLDVGEMADAIDCAGELGDEVRVQGTSLAEAIEGAAAPTVRIGSGDARNPLRIDGDGGYIAIVMPVAGSGS